MTSRTKRTLLAMTTLLALAAFFWMRSVAYWRPVKIARVTTAYADYDRGVKETGFGFLSDDEQFALLPPWDELFSDVIDLRGKSRITWRVERTWHVPVISRHSTESIFVFNQNEGKDVLEARDLRSGRLKRVYRWPVSPNAYGASWLLSPDEKTLWVIDAGRFFAWDIQSGRLLHQATLKHPFSDKSFEEAMFALSPDGTRLVGCWGRNARIWNLPSGEEATSWTVSGTASTLYKAGLYAFSPDGRVVIYGDNSGNKTAPLLLVDAATGKTLWQTTKYPFDQFFLSDDEMFVPQKNNCQVLDLFTGRPKRELPYPRQSDGQIFRVTTDSIYTVNAKAEIFRWRAR